MALHYLYSTEYSEMTEEQNWREIAKELTDRRPADQNSEAAAEWRLEVITTLDLFIGQPGFDMMGFLDATRE